MVCIASIKDELTKLFTHVLGYFYTFATEQAQMSVQDAVSIYRAEVTETRA